MTKNLLYSLPKHLVSKIYTYDSTFYYIYSLLMIELTFRFKELHEVKYLIRNIQRRHLGFYLYLQNEINLA